MNVAMKSGTVSILGWSSGKGDELNHHSRGIFQCFLFFVSQGLEVLNTSLIGYVYLNCFLASIFIAIALQIIILESPKYNVPDGIISQNNIA